MFHKKSFVSKNMERPLPVPKEISASTPPGNKPTRKEAPLPPEPLHIIDTGGDNHKYEKVSCPDDDNHYDKLVYTKEVADEDLNQRLKHIEETQDRIAKDFHLSQQAILGEIRRLSDSLEHLKTMSINVQRSVVESSTVLQETVENLKKQFLETSDHLGQHVLQVRRDVLNLKKEGGAGSTPDPASPQHDTRVKHNFEWDINSVENLVKTQGHVSSYSYHIGELNYKLLGAADFTKEGLMFIKISGESTHPSGNDHLTKSGRFECKVSVTDRSGNLVDWVIGKVSGDFFKDKVWMIGNASVPDLKRKGYCVQGKTFKLKFAIDIFK